jgi:hypothetical protein
MLHELGHAVGFNYLASGGTDGYQKWNDQIDATKQIFKLSPAFGGGNVTLAGGDANGLSHVDGTKYPNDLMKPTGALGVRDSISLMDVQMLVTAFGYTTPEPSSMILLGVGTASLLGYGWRRRKKAA